MSTAGIDVHQHLWPEPLIEALRSRTAVPYLRGWTLHTAGEAPCDIDPTAHVVADRAALDADRSLILLSMSTPLGIEALPPDEAAELLRAWHDGVLALGRPFGGWAAITEFEPDLDGLTAQLGNGFAGLQVAATQLLDPAAVERMAPTLSRCEELNRPVLVHPGPVSPAHGCPPWWPAVVQYPAQLQAAWWAWHVAGRALLPELRICFAAGGGLSALHHERFSARGGGSFVVDPGVFVDTSSYGRQGVDNLSRALGIDTIVLGSDRPYAEPVDPRMGDAAWRAITVTNPGHLLNGVTP